MALVAIEGVYKNGRVELTENPPGLEEGRVMVVFLPADLSKPAEETVSAGEARRAAGERLLARMKQGYHLGGGRPYENREELHDRHNRAR